MSPRFIYNHPDLRAEIERRAAEIGDQLAGSARVTTASLRADVANYKAEVQRQRVEINALRNRLSETLGVSYAAGLPEAERLVLASRDAQETIVELEQRAFEADEEMCRQREELESVRDLNRELMAKLNMSRS